MICQNCLLLNWNVRGLNNPARRRVVRDLTMDTKCEIAAIQETEMENIDAQIVSETLGQQFSQQFVFLPAQQTRGGVLLAVHQDQYKITQSVVANFSVSARVESKTSDAEWWITVVYGPQVDAEKIQFLQEIRQLQNNTSDKWLIIGDSNMVLPAEDKSNSSVARGYAWRSGGFSVKRIGGILAAKSLWELTKVNTRDNTNKNGNNMIKL